MRYADVMGNFHCDEKYEQAFFLWCRYYVDTENYDRAVCTGGLDRDGGAMPATSHERALINSNARMLHEKLRNEAAGAGIDAETMERAKGEASRLTHQAALDVLSRAKP